MNQGGGQGYPQRMKIDELGWDGGLNDPSKYDVIKVQPFVNNFQYLRGGWGGQLAIVRRASFEFLLHFCKSTGLTCPIFNCDSSIHPFIAHKSKGWLSVLCLPGWPSQLNFCLDSAYISNCCFFNYAFYIFYIFAFFVFLYYCTFCTFCTFVLRRLALKLARLVIGYFGLIDHETNFEINLFFLHKRGLTLGKF